MLAVISVVQLGALDYGEGLRLQRKLVELRKLGQIGDVLLLLEHSPVITLGRNAKAANVLASTEVLAGRGVEVFECDRGGDVTFHGPGQLVGYPIVDLRGFSRQPSAVSHQEGPSNAAAESFPSWRKTLGAVDYVRRLEEVLISRSVTSHGFALNVNTDLSYFNLIVPCGITAKAVTSMEKELGRELDLNEVAQAVSRNFGSVFESEMLWVETVDALLGNSVGVPLKAPDKLRRVHGDDELFVG